MLKLIFARSGYGKTEYTFKSIKTLVNDGFKDILLITPEQFSLAAERRLLTDLGEKGIGSVSNLSFTRISDTVKGFVGDDSLEHLSKSSKTIIMMKAIDLSKDNLLLFSKNLDTHNFVGSMINIYDEMKSCNLTPDEIVRQSSGIENEVLKNKMLDISTIMRTYELLIKGRYLDSANELTRLYERLENAEYFKNKYVFIDGFNGFVAQEYKILELIIKEASCVTITLCTDVPDSTDNYNLFAYVNNSSRIITKIANKAGVDVERVFLSENYRAKNNQMNAVERFIFNDKFDEVNENDKLKIYCASDINDECKSTAREIRALLRSGYRASDIAVITRDIDKYRDEISVVFKKYDIPFFNDERQPVKNQPLIIFIEYLLRCVNYSLRSDDIISLAKTGLTGIKSEDINELENYIYLWNINGSKWTKVFEGSPNGFTGELSNSEKRALEKINKTREQLISPILTFKGKIKGADIEKICASIYYTLIDFGVDEKIKEIAVTLAKSNRAALAQEQGRVWELVMRILDELPKCLDGNRVSLKELARIFSLVISTEDLGALPSGLDNIQFGQADRIRSDNPLAVFILGANEGDFPRNAVGGGLLTENDRRILLENDFKLYSYGEIFNLQERYFAYMACSAASERLYVSYIAGGNDSSPSEIVTSLKGIFNINECSKKNVSDIELIETYDNAFELMSEGYQYNTPFYSSLKKYFENDSRYSTICDLAENKDIVIKDNSISTTLFGNDMYVSASRVEDYYNCAFRYFCKFGLKARPRVKAEIDPMQRGTLIHYVLEMILSTVGSKGLSSLSENEIISLVDSFTQQYYAEQIGNDAALSIRFKYSYKRLSRLIYSVVIHLAEEFRHSDFEARAFELGIDRDGQVKPEILSLNDGGTIQIRGSIDRVDTYEKDGQRYVRVVDYKSGNKSFNLSDIMYGLNLQMFIYLFSLCEDKNASLSGTPAGVLYMHSARNLFSFDSRAIAHSSISSEESSSFKMKGIVLDDEKGVIAAAMENELEGKYIPVKIKKNGDLSGKLASLEELGFIHKKVNSLVSQMGMLLHQGNISHNPVKDKNHKHTCDYCDYKDVCANKRLIESRVNADLSDDEVKEQLKKEYSA